MSGHHPRVTDPCRSRLATPEARSSPTLLTPADRPAACRPPALRPARTRSRDCCAIIHLPAPPCLQACDSTFAPGREITRHLQELVALEAECCTFLTLQLTTTADAVSLTITGPPEAQRQLAEIFAPTS